MGQFDRKAQSQRKHGPLTISGASRAPVAPPAIRPGWKGPSYVKKQPARHSPSTSSSSASASTIQEQLLPVELEQLLLSIFRDTFPASKDFEALKPTLQEIKDALFQRDFERAFGREDYLEGYAVRWSPSRTLGYANLLLWICGERAREERWVNRLITEEAGQETVQEVNLKTPSKVVCFGGGAAEIMTFAGVLRHLRTDAAGKPDPSSVDQAENASESLSSLSISATPAILDLHLVDTANWASVVSELHTSLTTRPVLSKYASAAARASNASFLSPEALNPTFTQANILESSVAELRSMIGSDSALLTLMFTLNELYTASIAKTTAFLLKLTTATPKDSLLLVVDSPGSYSETAIGEVKQGEEGQEKKKYPMQWLMDHVLLEKGVKKVEGVETVPKWEKIVGEESRWFRLDESLKYPVSLENMRFQVHLFKRL